MEVASGHLADVDWREGVLVITFRDGKTYEYYDVPSGVFMELVNAPSKSEFFRANVKGVYEYARI